MPTSVLEIVDLGDGNIVLQRADRVDGHEGDDRGGRSEDDNEPLVTIRFSDEARMYILDQGLEVAKAMIQAGIQAAAQVAESADVEVETETDAEADEITARVLH